MVADIPILPLPPRVQRVPTGCPASVRFAAWVEERLTHLMREDPPSLIAIHQVVLRLTWQYFWERKSLEGDHRDRVTEANGERCVYGVFLDALEQLHELHMAAEKLEFAPRGVAAVPPPSSRPRSVSEALADALREVG